MAGKMVLVGVVHVCALVFLALAAVCVAVDVNDASVTTSTGIPVYRQEAAAKSIDDILSEQQRSSRKGQNENHWSWVQSAGMGNRLLRQYLTLHSQQHVEPAPAWDDKLEARILSRKGYGFYDEEQIKKDNHVNERLVEEALLGDFLTRETGRLSLGQDSDYHSQYRVFKIPRVVVAAAQRLYRASLVNREDVAPSQHYVEGAKLILDAWKLHIPVDVYNVYDKSKMNPFEEIRWRISEWRSGHPSTVPQSPVLGASATGATGATGAMGPTDATGASMADDGDDEAQPQNEYHQALTQGHTGLFDPIVRGFEELDGDTMSDEMRSNKDGTKSIVERFRKLSRLSATAAEELTNELDGTHVEQLAFQLSTTTKEQALEVAFLMNTIATMMDTGAARDSVTKKYLEIINLAKVKKLERIATQAVRKASTESAKELTHVFELMPGHMMHEFLDSLPGNDKKKVEDLAIVTRPLRLVILGRGFNLLGDNLNYESIVSKGENRTFVLRIVKAEEVFLASEKRDKVLKELQAMKPVAAISVVNTARIGELGAKFAEDYHDLSKDQQRTLREILAPSKVESDNLDGIEHAGKKCEQMGGASLCGTGNFMRARTVDNDEDASSDVLERIDKTLNILRKLSGSTEKCLAAIKALTCNNLIPKCNAECIPLLPCSSDCRKTIGACGTQIGKLRFSALQQNGVLRKEVVSIMGEERVHVFDLVLDRLLKCDAFPYINGFKDGCSSIKSSDVIECEARQIAQPIVHKSPFSEIGVALKSYDKAIDKLSIEELDSRLYEKERVTSTLYEKDLKATKLKEASDLKTDVLKYTLPSPNSKVDEIAHYVDEEALKVLSTNTIRSCMKISNGGRHYFGTKLLDDVDVNDVESSVNAMMSVLPMAATILSAEGSTLLTKCLPRFKSYFLGLFLPSCTIECTPSRHCARACTSFHKDCISAEMKGMLPQIQKQGALRSVVVTMLGAEGSPKMKVLDVAIGAMVGDCSEEYYGVDPSCSPSVNNRCAWRDYGVKRLR